MLTFRCCCPPVVGVPVDLEEGVVPWLLLSVKEVYDQYSVRKVPYLGCQGELGRALLRCGCAPKHGAHLPNGP